MAGREMMPLMGVGCEVPATAGLQGDFAEDRSREQRMAQAADALAARFLVVCFFLGVEIGFHLRGNDMFTARNVWPAFDGGRLSLRHGQKQKSDQDGQQFCCAFPDGLADGDHVFVRHLVLY